MSKKEFPVDLVYLWVDGNDEKFLETKKEYFDKYNTIPNRDFNAFEKARYADHKELRYSLRSVMENIPWINKIFIVTNGQVPDWLDINHPKIKLITHEQIMPKSALPTFNSCAIEACIGNIPELSEHFLYANDDSYIRKPVKKDFFFDKKGRPICRFTRSKNLQTKENPSLYSQSLIYSMDLINKRFKKNYKSIVPHHNIDSYLKSDCLKCTEEFREEFNAVINSRFRNELVQRMIYALYSLVYKRAKKKLVSNYRKFRPLDSMRMLINSYKTMYKMLYIKNPTLFCLNDEAKVHEDYRKELKYFLEGEFPNAQEWETKVDKELTKISLQKRKEHIEQNQKEVIKEKKDRFKKRLFSIYYYIIQGKLNIVFCFLGFKNCFVVLDENNIQKRYKKLLSKLRKKYKKEKIKVAFLVAENQKWTYQSLYELFEKSEHFDPVVLITRLVSVHDGKDTTRSNLEENYNFFKSRGIKTEFLYENNQPKDLRLFKPDILFYEQPWDMFKKNTPLYTSKYALTCYCSYGFESLELPRNYSPNFQRLLFRYFVEHELNLERYKTYSELAQNNCVATGYPKLDVYFDKKSDKNFFKESEKFKIIYAPHHSFDNSLRLATFLENGRFILDLAKKHPETTWLFKPHPRLKFALKKTGFMSDDEIEKYYGEWEKIGAVYTQGDYFDIFKESDLMITDCLSFLAEYLPSKKPLIRLISKDALPLNSLGELVVSKYYTCETEDELCNLFDEIVTKRNDYLKEERINLCSKVVDMKEKAANKIFRNLEEALK